MLHIYQKSSVLDSAAVGRCPASSSSEHGNKVPLGGFAYNAHRSASSGSRNSCWSASLPFASLPRYTHPSREYPLFNLSTTLLDLLCFIFGLSISDVPIWSLTLHLYMVTGEGRPSFYARSPVPKRSELSLKFSPTAFLDSAGSDTVPTTSRSSQTAGFRWFRCLPGFFVSTSLRAAGMIRARRAAEPQLKTYYR